MGIAESGEGRGERTGGESDGEEGHDEGGIIVRRERSHKVENGREDVEFDLLLLSLRWRLSFYRRCRRYRSERSGVGGSVVGGIVVLLFRELFPILVLQTPRLRTPRPDSSGEVVLDIIIQQPRPVVLEYPGVELDQSRLEFGFLAEAGEDFSTGGAAVAPADGVASRAEIDEMGLVRFRRGSNSRVAHSDGVGILFLPRFVERVEESEMTGLGESSHIYTAQESE